jgi:excisionase family DNA binding protein
MTNPVLREAASNRANLLNRKEAAAYLGVKEQTLACWACAGRYHLPFVRVGRLVKYRLQDLDAFILANRIGAEGSHAV